MIVTEAQGLPVGELLESATPHEKTLIEKTLQNVQIPDGSGNMRNPVERLIYDRASDYDDLRDALREQGVDLIVPHRGNRKKSKRQNGGKLRRFKKRWKVERTFAWLGNFRRLLVRHERLIEVYRAFFHIACLMIVLKRF